jgi:hypothetical protein
MLTNVDRLDADSMNAGIVRAKWFKHEARRVYAMLDESEAGRDQRRLVEWIDRNGSPVAAREVQQGCRWLKAPGAAEAALADLVKAGRGCWQDTQASEKGGRPSRVFTLSTVSTVYETPTTDPASWGSIRASGRSVFRIVWAISSVVMVLPFGTGFWSVTPCWCSPSIPAEVRAPSRTTPAC